MPVQGKGPGKAGSKIASKSSASKHVSEENSKAKGKAGVSKTPAASSSKGGSTAETTAESAPKKPDTRTLISGSASWTGKLPVNLLSEHLQKQKWEKPEYAMVPLLSG